MAPRRVLLGLLLVVCAVFTASVSAQAATTTTVTTTNTTAPASFCEACRDKGNCAQAYKGSPGIFCGAWLNAASQRMACCCPANGQCAKTPSNYECMCQGGSTAKPTKAPSKDSKSSKSWIFIVLAVIVLGVIAVGLYFYCKRSNDYDDDHHKTTTVVVEQPVYAAHQPQPVYGQPVYGGQPGYGGQPQYNNNQGGGGGYSGGAVAAAAGAGAVGGLIGGMVISDMMADAGHHGGGGGGGGNDYSGGGGGGDVFAGDF